MPFNANFAEALQDIASVIEQKKKNKKTLQELWNAYVQGCDKALKRLDVLGFDTSDLHEYEDDEEHEVRELYYELPSLKKFKGCRYDATPIDWLDDDYNSSIKFNPTDQEYFIKILELIKRYGELFGEERLPQAFSKLLSEGKDKENLDEETKEKLVFIINAIFEPKELIYTFVDDKNRLSSTAIKMSYKLESAFDALKSKVEDFCDEVLKDSETVSFKPEA